MLTAKRMKTQTMLITEKISKGKENTNKQFNTTYFSLSERFHIKVLETAI